jgi:hypothetical protein
MPESYPLVLSHFIHLYAESKVHLHKEKHLVQFLTFLVIPQIDGRKILLSHATKVRRRTTMEGITSLLPF